MAFLKSTAHEQEESAPTSASASRGSSRLTRPQRPVKLSQPELTPEDVLANTDIVELISDVVELRPRGDEFIGLCPFHSDSHPSFEVNATKGMYSCWSCSAGMGMSRGGDAITFVRRYYGMNFSEALAFLARRAGMPVPSRYAHTATSAAELVPGTGAKVFGQPQRPKTVPAPNRALPDMKADPGGLYRAMDMAMSHYQAQLHANRDVIEYLVQKRGISPSLLGRYLIGYAPDSFDGLAPIFPDYQKDRVLLDAGLVRENSTGKRYDFFRDRLLFGVRDALGRICAFGGRRINDETKLNRLGEPVRIAKYINSPETAIFNKSEVLFGWFEAQEAVAKEGFALVVEGYMDVLGLAAQSIDNAVACMGTALSEQHAKFLLANTSKIVFCFDGDRAGQTAALRSLIAIIPALNTDKEVRFVTLPGGQDPDEFVRTHGKAAFMKCVRSADGLVQFWQRALLELYPARGDALWEGAHDLLRPIPADSPRRASLERIAARLAEKPLECEPQGEVQSKVIQSRAKATGLSSRVAMEPSNRLWLAVLKAPDLAAAIRPQLIHAQRNIDASLLGELSAWQAKFDQSMAAGMSTKSSDNGTSGLEMLQYRRIIEAAPSILNQFLEVRKKELRMTSETATGTKETEKHNTMSGSSSFRFVRPR